MNKHTPTPWKVSGEVSNWIVTKKGDMPILQARGLAFSVGEAKANAEYVVRCVNSHEALVQALEDCVRIFENELSGLAVIGPELRQARAAVAAAKGQP